MKVYMLVAAFSLVIIGCGSTKEPIPAPAPKQEIKEVKKVKSVDKNITKKQIQKSIKQQLRAYSK